MKSISQQYARRKTMALDYAKCAKEIFETLGSLSEFVDGKRG